MSSPTTYTEVFTIAAFGTFFFIFSDLVMRYTAQLEY